MADPTELARRGSGAHHRWAGQLSRARMIGFPGMSFEFVGVEIDGPEIARRVAPGLVVEMGRGGLAAFAVGGDRPGAQAGAHRGRRGEAVAAGAVPAPRARPGA